MQVLVFKKKERGCKRPDTCLRERPAAARAGTGKEGLGKALREAPCLAATQVRRERELGQVGEELGEAVGVAGR